MWEMSSSAIRSAPSKSVRNQKITAVRRRPREQVAAVCYRIEHNRLEFLLVRTRKGGRWIFPKGGVEPGLTRSQSAALEALEEAGVEGTIEEAPFAAYAIWGRAHGEAGSKAGLSIGAYLFAVQWVNCAHEENRDPSWFSPEKAKKRLSQGCERRFAQELCGVVDRAVQRIQRLQSCDMTARDPLRRAYFDAPPKEIQYHRPVSSPIPQKLEGPLASQRIVPAGLRLRAKVFQLNSAPLPGRDTLVGLALSAREVSQRPAKKTRWNRS
jgi:8-oxo-dGTP pyrophosphatase MutT (NUDIX family)